jgi:L-malate glycosyltransferase
MTSPPEPNSLPPITVMWENFGPTHHDRLRALAKAGFETHAVELFSVTEHYQWDHEQWPGYEVHTLGDRESTTSSLVLFWRLVRCCLKTPARDIFMCHYEKKEVLAAAFVLRLFGRRVYAMYESKFDDYPRALWREVGKSLFVIPYSGAIAASRRTQDYLRFLGMRRRPIEIGYAMIDVERIRSARAVGNPEADYAERPFLVVARFIPKKNIATVLEAFADYRTRYQDRRELHIVGYGALQKELEAKAAELELAGAVKFVGLLQAPAVADKMAQSLALVLASTEEQSGLVVNEALAAGLPVIVTSNAGAIDVLVENLGNGRRSSRSSATLSSRPRYSLGTKTE